MPPKVVALIVNGQVVKTEISQLKGESLEAAFWRTVNMVRTRMGVETHYTLQETLRKVG